MDLAVLKSHPVPEVQQVRVLQRALKDLGFRQVLTVRVALARLVPLALLEVQMIRCFLMVLEVLLDLLDLALPYHREVPVVLKALQVHPLLLVLRDRKVQMDPVVHLDQKPQGLPFLLLLRLAQRDRKALWIL